MNNHVLIGPEKLDPSKIEVRFDRPRSWIGEISPPAAEKGEKGDEGASPGIAISNAEFMVAAFAGLPDGAVAVICSKVGDPEKGAWRADPALEVDAQCPSTSNNYFNCSSFRPNDKAVVTAQKIQFAAYHALMLDDLGSKVDLERLGAIEPTWMLETSPGNFQAGFLLKEPITDPQEVERLQKAVVSAGLCDPGAIGLSRWARLPTAINGKSKYRVQGEAFRCRLHRWQPQLAYSKEELIAGLRLKLAPPLPSLPMSGHKNRDHVPVIGQDIFTPRPTSNPVVSRLRDLNLYKSERSPGTHDITCPWVTEHSDQLDSGTAYFEPTLASPRGGFRCHHSHGERYHVGELIEFLQLSPSQARNRARIRMVAGDLSSILHAAELALAASGQLYQSGGVIVSVHTDPHSGDIHTEAVSEQALTQRLAEAVDWEKMDGRSGKWVRCDPPARIVALLHKAQSYTALPNLRGLARQPYFREEDGELVTRSGYDPLSGKLASFSEKQFHLGDTNFDGAKRALARLEKLLEEFHFASDVDRSAALSAMLTAAVRPTLPVAPAFNVTASGIGSGKTYLCSTIIPFAGAGDPQTITYPPTSEEAAKVILSLLLQAPYAIFFDDMDRDWLAHGPINRMLTSPTTSERILGVSKTVTVGTRTLVLGSGNNVEPLRDLRRRVISIRLSPRTSSPAMLSYRGRPAEEVKANRAGYVSDALTIIEAWRQAGRPRTGVFDIATYHGLWSDYCRQTLLWLGLPDPASSLRDQIRSDPDSDALGDFLEAWFKRFGECPVTVRRLVGSNDVMADDLKEALEDLPINGPQGINRSKLGWYLKKQSFRIVRGLQVEPAESSERNAWKVVKVADDLANFQTPPFTSFREAEAEISPG